MVYVNFPTYDEYLRRMVEDFGFTEVEAKSHTKTGRSYLAVPIFTSDESESDTPQDEGVRRRRLVGVMYFFSTETQVFPIAVDRDAVEHHANDVAALLRASGIVRLE
jgi:hypothetical protein